MCSRSEQPSSTLPRRNEACWSVPGGALAPKAPQSSLRRLRVRGLRTRWQIELRRCHRRDAPERITNADEYEHGQQPEGFHECWRAPHRDHGLGHRSGKLTAKIAWVTDSHWGLLAVAE